MPPSAQLTVVSSMAVFFFKKKSRMYIPNDFFTKKFSKKKKFQDNLFYVQIGSRKSSSERCYTPKVVLFKKSLRNAESISALDYHGVCLTSVDESIVRCRKQLLLLCIVLQSGLLVAFRISMFFAGKSRKILTKTLFSTLR